MYNLLLIMYIATHLCSYVAILFQFKLRNYAKTNSYVTNIYVATTYIATVNILCSFKSSFFNLQYTLLWFFTSSKIHNMSIAIRS